MFQNTLQKHLQGLKGVRNIADDIILYGKTHEEHDENLEHCLARLESKGFILNQGKCQFFKKTLATFRQIFTKEGTHPDPKRGSDLLNALIPKNTWDVRSLLGMANYSSKYIANFAKISAPLRDLAKKNTPFEWTNKHQTALRG